MDPFSQFDKLPLHYRHQKKLDVKRLRPWLRYKFDRLWGTTSNGERFAYYVERGEPVVMQFEYLENEFFANDLQKVNVTRTDSILRFCEKYGFPASSGYDGAQRLAWYRRRFEPSAAGFSPISCEHGLSAHSGAIEAGIPLSKAAEEHVDRSLIGKHPYLLSEEARRIHLEDRSVVGAVSEAEIIQTIRALQVSTALLTAIGYAVDSPNDWGATAVAEYLCQRSHMAQNGVTFFLRSDSDGLLNNTRLKPYDALLTESPEFRAQVEAGEAQGLNTRLLYTSSLGEGLVLASNVCIDFLINSLLSYGNEIYEGLLGTDCQERCNMGIWKSAEIKARRILSKTEAENYAQYGCLSEAIISQFGLLYDDPAEWRICDNCGRIFKKYREEKPGKVIQKTRFCKRSCANSYSKKKSQRLITE